MKEIVTCKLSNTDITRAKLLTQAIEDKKSSMKRFPEYWIPESDLWPMSAYRKDVTIELNAP